MVWYGQMTSEFIHEEISIMDCNGLSSVIIVGGGHHGLSLTVKDLCNLAVMDEFHGLLSWMTRLANID